MLMFLVLVLNCIKFYQIVEDIGVKELQKYCVEIIFNYWVGFFKYLYFLNIVWRVSDFINGLFVLL